MKLAPSHPPSSPCLPQELPKWNYDGSSTGQAPGHDSEVFLIPRSMFKDPFRGGDNILVMCDAYEPPRVNPDGTLTEPKVGRGATCIVHASSNNALQPCRATSHSYSPGPSLTRAILPVGFRG